MYLKINDFEAYEPSAYDKGVEDNFRSGEDDFCKCKSRRKTHRQEFKHTLEKHLQDFRSKLS